MGLYSQAPEYRSFTDDKPTLLVCWWCTTFAATIILFRVCGRYIRTEKLFMEDWLAFSCLIPMLIRMAFVQVIILYGTNNALAPSGGWSEEERRRREIGSRLVLASRVFYAATLWMCKFTVMEFLRRLTQQIWKRSYEYMLQAIRWFLVLTFIAVIVSDVAECQPITHYWLVKENNPPVAGQCRQGFVQLITMGVCNVLTDLLLVVFPIPIIIKSQMTLKRKSQLVLLFCLSIIPVGITLYRVPAIINRHGVQQYRSVWASIEILLATGVANALILGSFVRDRGVKKVKWKFGSTTDSMERTSTRRATVIQSHWGSDEDLVRDMSMALDPSLRETQKGVRPAPMAVSSKSPLDHIKFDHITEDWAFPLTGQQASRNSDVENGRYRDHDACQGQEAYSPGEISVTTPSRKVSFFDIGGLLDEEPQSATSRTRLNRFSVASDLESNSGSNDLSPTTTHKGSQALMLDVGGLPGSAATPKAARSVNGYGKSWRTGNSENGQGFELCSIPQKSEMPDAPPVVQRDFADTGKRNRQASLQDVGGLLR